MEVERSKIAMDLSKVRRRNSRGQEEYYATGRELGRWNWGIESNGDDDHGKQVRGTLVNFTHF